MALTIVATAGASNANSYETLDEFKAYLATHPDGAAALVLTDDALMRAQITATHRFDALIEWDGSRVTGTQALAHPRYGLYLDGWSIASDAVHARLKLAHMEYARLILQDGLPSALSDSAGIRKQKIGPMEIEYEPGGGSNAVDAIPDDVWYLLPREWGHIRDRGGVQMVKLTRV